MYLWFCRIEMPIFFLRCPILKGCLLLHGFNFNKHLQSLWGLSRGIQPCTMNTRDIYWRWYKVQETLYIGQWCLSTLQRRHFWTSHKFSQLPSAALLYFPDFPEISSISKVILVFGKARSCSAPNLGCRGLSHLGDLMFHQNSTWDTMHERALCPDKTANHQL